MKFAEVFDFGRVNRTGTSDLVLWSPDGDSGRPVGKDECRGNPKGKPAGGAFSFGYFSLGMQRKVTRPTGRNLMPSHIKKSRHIISNTLEFAAVILQTTPVAPVAHVRVIALLCSTAEAQLDE